MQKWLSMKKNVDPELLSISCNQLATMKRLSQKIKGRDGEWRGNDPFEIPEIEITQISPNPSSTVPRAQQEQFKYQTQHRNQPSLWILILTTPTPKPPTPSLTARSTTSISDPSGVPSQEYFSSSGPSIIPSKDPSIALSIILFLRPSKIPSGIPSEKPSKGPSGIPQFHHDMCFNCPIHVPCIDVKDQGSMLEWEFPGVIRKYFTPDNHTSHSAEISRLIPTYNAGLKISRNTVFIANTICTMELSIKHLVHTIRWIYSNWYSN